MMDNKYIIKAFGRYKLIREQEVKDENGHWHTQTREGRSEEHKEELGSDVVA